MSGKYKYYGSLILVLLFLFGCSSKEKADMSIVPETGECDMSVYMGIEEEHCFRSISLNEMDSLIKKGGSGIFYMGYEACSYCQSLLQYLNKAGLECGVTIYYLDAYDEEYPLYKDEFEAIYIEDLYDTLREEDGEKVLYTPQVFTVVNGQVKDSLIAADDWTVQDPTSQQIDKVIKIYKKMFEPFMN